MAMFLAEISFLLALALFAGGLVLWQRGREATAGLLRAAGAVLVVGAVLTALCTGYFSVRYHVQGEFDHAYPHPAAVAARGMMGPACPQQGQRGMGPGMMGTGMMQPGTQGMPMLGGPPVQGIEPSETPPGHEGHDPDE
ncbi:MAG TPA: hypothetical protein VMN39_03565 [Longimicrobiaceae bacterium]|nr:hypothetical protein [Longimicrobiaceae bacterium]